MTIEEKREKIREAADELPFEDAQKLSAFLTGLAEQRAVFPAEEKNFRDFEATEGDLAAAQFLLYSWGRSIERGCASDAAESLTIFAELWPKETVRALAAAYTAVLHEMPKKGVRA